MKRIIITLAVLATAVTGAFVGASVAAATTAKAAIVVEQTKVIYEPDQTGGHYHEVFGLVRNTTGSWKSLTGQFSIRDGRGLVGTPDANPITIAPHAEALMQANAVSLPRPVRWGHVTLTVEASEPFFGAPSRGAISLTKPRYSRGGDFGECVLSVTATNNTAKTKLIWAVSVVGLSHGRIVTGGFDFPTLYPHVPKIVEIAILSPALCPAHVDQARAYWSS